MNQHYAEPLTSRRIASHVGWTREHLARTFRSSTGRTVMDYLQALRVEKALPLLEQGEKTEWVAMAVGFRSKSSFYRHFRRIMGGTPSAWHRLCGDAEGVDVMPPALTRERPEQ